MAKNQLDCLCYRRTEMLRNSPREPSLAEAREYHASMMVYLDRLRLYQDTIRHKITWVSSLVTCMYDEQVIILTRMTFDSERIKPEYEI